MKRAFWLLIMIALVVGCARTGSPPHDEQETDVTALPAWIQAVRRGDNAEIQDRKTIESWLDGNMKRGTTTREDVLAFFGKPGKGDPSLSFDLDRPERDKTVTYQYCLWNTYGNAAFLVVHFDSDTDVLSDWEISHWICGYCPHVFAHDGRWRLEGKMLAGCVGEDAAGSDTLLLPRLHTRRDRCFVKMCNLAPEIDYIMHAGLATVALHAEEELDVALDGELVVWRPQQVQRVCLKAAPGGRFSASIDVNETLHGDVIVLEVRNTTAFEAAMRRVVLDRETECPDTGLLLDFGCGTARVNPVGTKFLRRVVVGLPAQANRVTLTAGADFWHVRRVWIGKESVHGDRVTWSTPIDDSPIILKPMQGAILEFSAPNDFVAGKERVAYALRIKGYYDFMRDANKELKATRQ